MRTPSSLRRIIPVTFAVTAPLVFGQKPCEVSLRAHEKINKMATTYLERSNARDQTDPPIQLPLQDLCAIAILELAALPDLGNPQSTRAEVARRDKQLGASSDMTVATSIVTKPNFARLLSAAIDSGTIAQDVRGTVLTLSTTPYALVAARLGDTSTTYAEYGKFSRVSISASFNVSNTGTGDGDESLSDENFKGFGISIRLSGDHSPRSEEMLAVWRNNIEPLINEKVAPILIATNNIRMNHRAEYDAWAEVVVSNAKKAPDVAVLAQMFACAVTRDFNIRPTSAELESLVADATPVYDLIALHASERWRSALRKAAAKPQLSLNYANIRGMEPKDDYSTIKLAWERGVGGPLVATVNGGVSLYHDPQADLNQETLKDINVAAQIEGAIVDGMTTDKQSMVFSVAAKYQHVLENRGVAGKRTDIAMIQGRLEIPFGDFATLPISITWANAASLIDAADVRAHFGITVDMDKLFASRSAR